jgi:hypothetical protein
MLDPTKPVQLRDGRPARIICNNMKGNRPIIALMESEGGYEFTIYRKADGKFGSGKHPFYLDLINVPTTIKGYVGVYHTDLYGVMPGELRADDRIQSLPFVATAVYLSPDHVPNRGKEKPIITEIAFTLPT